MSEMIRITARDPVNNKYEEIQGTDGGGLLTAAMGNTVADGSGDNKHMLVNSSGHQSVVIESGATPAITGFSTATLQGAGLPAALSAASNLKVSVEESSPARTSVQNNSGVVAGAAVLSTIDARSYRSLRLFGDATASFKVQGSIDNSNFYNVVSVYPDEDSNFSVTVDKVPPYVRIQNDATSQTMVVESALMD